jgi:hypothetical protein
VDRAEQAFLARRDARELAARQQSFLAELDAALAGACLQFDPAPAAAVFERWVARQPALAAAGRERVSEHVQRCVAQLEALDEERAVALQQRSERLFGTLPGLESLREDPCGADYLVGSGGQAGRRGSCADRVGGLQGPRLVVVPWSDGGASFAITRQEVSWGDLAPFCEATGRCEARGDADQPVTGVPVDVARDYAVWLSEQTGFRYRLPTHREWLQAARGTSDPNRNCQVQLGGVTRGLAPVAVGTGSPNPFGLLNVLGNVQEWVVDGGGIKAAGGAYVDPIGECAVETLRDQLGVADAATGFRLVREVS